MFVKGGTILKILSGDNMKKIVLFLVLSTLLCSCAPSYENPISDDSLIAIQSSGAVEDWQKTLNETDECSSTNRLNWLAETFLEKNWYDCCIQHDFDYREGSKYGITKAQADYELWECIEASGHPYVANIVYDAVVLFGGSSFVEVDEREKARSW